MDAVRIVGNIIFSGKYAKTSNDFFTEVFLQWNDPEYIHNYVNKNKRFLENNLFFQGYTLQEVKTAIIEEALNFRTTFYELIKNSLQNQVPGLEHRFVVLSSSKKPPDVRRKMYGHEEDPSRMVSVLRLYAIRLPSNKSEELPAYLIIGGAIKFTDNMFQMKNTNYILSRFQSVQAWLKRVKITYKEDLIQYIDNHEQHND